MLKKGGVHELISVSHWWRAIFAGVLMNMVLIAIKSRSSAVWSLEEVVAQRTIPLLIIGLIVLMAAGIRRGLRGYLRQTGALADREAVEKAWKESRDTTSSGGRVTGLRAIPMLVKIARPRTGVPGLLAFGVGVAVAGMDKIGGVASFSAGDIVVGAVVSYLLCISSNFGNALSDTVEDSINLPHRVQIARALGATLHRVAVGSFLVIPLLGLLVRPAFAVTTLVFTVMMSQYSAAPLRVKRHPLGSLLLFSGVVGGPVILGWLAGGSPVAVTPFSFCLLFTLMTWFGTFGTAKNVQDYDGDRASGLLSSATVFRSRREAAIFSLVAQAVTFGLWAGLCFLGVFPVGFWIVMIWLLPVLFNGWATVRHHGSVQALQRVQAAFFVYPAGLLATVQLLIDDSITIWLIVASAALIALGADLLRLDARLPDAVGLSRRG